MTPDEDDLDQLLAAASAAARRPSPAPAAADPVAELLATAEDLSHGATAEDAPADDVAVFLAQARRSTSDAGSGGAGRAKGPKARPVPAPRPAPQAAAGGARRPTGLLVVLGVVAAVAIAFVAYAIGHGSAAPAAAGAEGASSASSAVPVDPAQVAALMQKITANPQDTTSLQTLGNMYYDANDFANALVFYEKIAVITPKDDGSWIAVAAAAYQSGKEDRAVEAWNKALGINPDNIEAHYGLGFYNLDKTPSDEAKARAEWAKVVAIAPQSDLAKQVQAELDRLGSQAATPVPAAS
jgi:tetratricopeptide (TPR) repeat protein